MLRCRPRTGDASFHESWNIPAYDDPVIILGILLAVCGALFGISLLLYLGIILIVVGLVLLFAGSTGRTIGGRQHWY